MVRFVSYAKPTFKKAAKVNEGILFVYADAEKYPQSRKLATVSNLPTFASFSGGELALNKTGSKKFIQEVEMRLPVVKKVVQFIDENDANQVEQAVELLTEMPEARGITEKK